MSLSLDCLGFQNEQNGDNEKDGGRGLGGSRCRFTVVVCWLFGPIEAESLSFLQSRGSRNRATISRHPYSNSDRTTTQPHAQRNATHNNTMEITAEYTLKELVARKDHINTLRYIRIHQLREPEQVVTSGKLLLGQDLSHAGRGLSQLARLAALEQICLAALDLGQSDVSDKCLYELAKAGVSKTSTRFQMLVGRCMEFDGDALGALEVYKDCLKENPANSLALKRKYCIVRAQPNKHVESAEILNEFLKSNRDDIASWRELCDIYKELGHFPAAAYCLEQVLMATNSDEIHVELAECLASAGSIQAGRQHMAAALELNPENVRALFGLVSLSSQSMGSTDEFEADLARELVKFSAERILQMYDKSNPMYSTVARVVKEYM
jgi:ER membrane protein complex subunit 2